MKINPKAWATLSIVSCGFLALLMTLYWIYSLVKSLGGLDRNNIQNGFWFIAAATLGSIISGVFSLTWKALRPYVVADAGDHPCHLVRSSEAVVRVVDQCTSEHFRDLVKANLRSPANGADKGKKVIWLLRTWILGIQDSNYFDLDTLHEVLQGGFEIRILAPTRDNEYVAQRVKNGSKEFDEKYNLASGGQWLDNAVAYVVELARDAQRRGVKKATTKIKLRAYRDAYASNADHGPTYGHMAPHWKDIAANRGTTIVYGSASTLGKRVQRELETLWDNAEEVDYQAV
jgi:hypothetical protein